LKKKLLEFLKKGSVEIFGKKIVVESFGKKELPSSMGEADIKAGKVWLSEELPEDTKAETLMHEMIHIISADLNLSLTEQQVAGLSVALYSIFK